MRSKVRREASHSLFVFFLFLLVPLAMSTGGLWTCLLDRFADSLLVVPPLFGALCFGGLPFENEVQQVVVCLLLLED